MSETTTGWSDYWEGVDHRHIFAVEAVDHVARLRRAITLSPTDRVLDFGCGFGHVVELLAKQVATVGYWDASQTMRDATARRTAVLDTVSEVELTDAHWAEASGGFDLVVANSVVQYMSPDELAEWMRRWKQLLAPGGRVVLADIPRPGASTVTELVGMLRFAAKHGFLLKALREGFEEARRYSKSRTAVDLAKWEPAQLVALAAEQGLTAEVLPQNLTHRSIRFTVSLTAA